MGQSGEFSCPRVRVHRERSVVEARQETPRGQASSAGVEGRRVSQARSVFVVSYLLFVGWLVGLFASLLVCL